MVVLHLQTLASLANQTVQDFEVILAVTAVCTDVSQCAVSLDSVCRDLRRACSVVGLNDPPAYVAFSGKQQVSIVYNRALANAKGTFIMFLQPDDRLEPEALERVSLLVCDSSMITITTTRTTTTIRATPCHRVHTHPTHSRPQHPTATGSHTPLALYSQAMQQRARHTLYTRFTSDPW
jgi:glycosyltransferase involved in cell wall biosynthesis